MNVLTSYKKMKVGINGEKDVKNDNCFLQ